LFGPRSAAGQDPGFAVSIECGEEALQGDAIAVEAAFAAAAHVGEALDRTPEVAVRVPPGGDAVEVRFDETVLLGERGPARQGILHPRRQGAILAVVPLPGHVEVLGDPLPHPAPAEDVAVGDVERRVGGGRGGRGPHHLLGEEIDVGDVGDAVPLRFGAGEDERPSVGSAELRVGPESECHVHRVPGREPDDRVGAMRAPGEAGPLGGGEELVLLRVVEVRDLDPRLLLVERRIG
jgi:hypothetical protein